MAYIAFQDCNDVAARQPWRTAPVADPASSGTDRLSELEWLVVAIARKDGRASLRRPGRVTTALRALFSRPNPMLTDPRLEALRRIAVLTWQRGYSVPPHEVRAFFAAGFTTGQYETLADHIGAVRIGPPDTVRLDGSRSATADGIAMAHSHA